MRRSRSRAGFSLVEIAIAVAIVGIISAIAIPSFSGWMDGARVRGAAREVADAFSLARSEAIRTGNNHIVFFAIPAITGVSGGGIPVDPVGNEIVDDSGNPVPILVLNDGAPTASNCQIDAGEARQGFAAELNVNWGPNQATSKMPNDTTAALMDDGSSFASPDNPAAPVAWVLFRGGDGIPVTFAGDPVLGCGTIGQLGTGNGGIYISNASRDYAAVLAPIGGVSVRGWDPSTNGWN